MTAKLNRHLCQSMWMREKIRFSTFRKKSGFQTPLLSNTCAQRRRTRRSRRRKRRRSGKKGCKKPKICGPEQRKAPNINDLSCKVLQLCVESRFAPSPFIKEQIFFPKKKKKNYSMNADSNGNGVLRRRQSAFKV